MAEKLRRQPNPPRSPFEKGGSSFPSFLKGGQGGIVRTVCLPTLFVLLLSSSAAGFDLGGYLKSLNMVVENPPAGDIPSGEFSSNRLRLDLTGTAAEIQYEFSVENLLLYTDPAGLLPLPGDSVNRTVDLETEWNRDRSFADQLFVDRLNLRKTWGGTDWTIGRQAVGFGRILLFSPLDVIAPFPPDALDTDVRPGVDAFRGVRYFGLGGQIGGIVVLGDEEDNNSYLATFSWNIAGVDLLGLAGSLRERPMGGIGAAGSLGGLGVKAEIAAYDGKEVGAPDGDLHGSFAVGAVELWYRFENDLVLVTQYLYNGAGAEEPADYPRAAASAPFREGLSFLLGRHYLLAGPSYEIHPLVTLNGLLIWNLEDDSFLLRPLADISLSDNLDLQLFWNFSQGRSPRRLPFTPLPLPRSEFGSAGDSGGAFLKYYF